MTNPPAVALAAAWITAMLAWIGTVCESLGIDRFWPWAYRFGLKVADLPAPELDGRPLASLRSSDKVVVAVRSESEAFFHAPINLFDFRRVQSTTPIKGRIERGAAGTRIVGYQSLLLFLFIAIWVGAWTFLGLRAAQESPKEGWGFVLGGWAVAVGIGAFWTVLERWRFKAAVADLVGQARRGA